MTQTPADRVRAIIALRDNDRPVHAAEEVEHLIAMVTGLLGEVSLLATKVNRLEHQLAAATDRDVAAVREEDLGEGASGEQAATREAMLERVFQSYTGAYSAVAKGEDPPN